MTSTNEMHPLRELHRFAQGDADAEERQKVVRHLLRGCASCAATLRGELAPVADLDALSAAVDRVLERSQALVHQVDDHRARAIEGIETLDTLSAERQDEWIDALETLDRRIVCEMLTERCRDSRHQDASLHLRLAQLAVRAAEGMEDSGRDEWMARSLAELGNARRIPGDLAGAAQALAQAEAIVEDTEELPEVAALLDFYRATLAHDQRRFAEAMSHYEKARDAYRQLEDEDAEIGALIGMGFLQGHWTESKDGIPYLEEALRRLDADQPDLQRITLHNLAHLYLDAGDPETAAVYVRQAQPLFDADAPRLDRLRFEWLTGRLQRDLGRLEEAASWLEGIRHSYSEAELPYEVALVSLDLAAVYAQSGRRESLKELAAETLDLFRSLGIAKESLVALNLLATAEASEALDLVARLTGVLERRHPQLGGIGLGR